VTISLTLAWNDDPTGIGAAYHDVVQESVQNAFALWLGHFDVSWGSVVILVNFLDLTSAASAGPLANTTVGTLAGTTVLLSSFASQIAFGAAQGSTGAVLNIGTSWLMNTFPTASHPQVSWLGDDARVFEHELGHALGLDSWRTWTTGALGSAYETTYDQDIRMTGGSTAVFAGPNAMAQLGGPVPLEVGSGFHPDIGGKISVMSYVDAAQSIQTLDVDLLKDAGLPILTDREVNEHMVVRLYAAVFDRAADPGGLVHWTKALAAGATLHDVAADFLSSAEFAQLDGTTPTNEALVDQEYRQALHRAPDASGEASWIAALGLGMSRADLLTGFSESAENRQALSASANVGYAATVEEEVARLYAMCLQRDADPPGFTNWTNALINGDTLGQVAAQFIQSSEFVADHGNDISNEAFATTLYSNELEPGPNAGWANCLAELNAGWSRADMVVSVSDSPDNILRMAALAVVGGAGSLGTRIDAPLGMIPTHGVLSPG
jgi:Domain of unknown function (DUF4214)